MGTRGAKRGGRQRSSRLDARHPSLEPPAEFEARRFSFDGEELVAFSFPRRELHLPATLSPAEREVAELVLGGLSNAEIAAQRGTALRTVANQIAVIFAKLGVGSRAELVVLLADQRATNRETES
jgi:DNA-binding CsgD family transcriptional regulator